MNDVWGAFLLSALAGSATVAGCLIALVLKQEHEGLIAFLSAFAAGVMLYGAMTEIFKKGTAALQEEFSPKAALGISALAFFSGIAFLLLLSRFLPEEDARRRTAVFVFLSLTLHNFPEGLATFLSALSSPSLAAPMVCAIALHNIPEGLAVSVPMMRAGKSRRVAFFYSVFSGAAEPLGAAFGAFVLLPVLSGAWLGLLFSFAAGLMAYLSLFELLPDTLAVTKNGTVLGYISGMATMALSLILFL